MTSEHGAAAIELVGVSKRYGETVALVDVEISVKPGEFFVLLGPSGCGKSTVLKIIAGLEDATEGEVYIGDRLVNYVAPKARDVAMVFQNYALYPHMTVEGNIAFPLKMTRHPKEEIRQRVGAVVRLLELEPELRKYPEQLSGGQRQRVALGRAIVRDPVAFLMDEPLSNLDALLRVQMRDELLKLHRRVERTTLYVTHDQVEALTMADRIVILRSGVVQQIGTPDEIYRTPGNIFVASFVGSPQMNLLPGRLDVQGEEMMFVCSDVRIPLTGVVTGGSVVDVTLGTRPEDIEVAGTTDEGVAGRVTLVQRAGADVFLTVALAPQTSCVVRALGNSGFKVGDAVRLRISPEHVHVFDAAGDRLGRSASGFPRAAGRG